VTNKYLRAALTQLPQLLLIVVAILAGWGLDDFAGFTSEPARVLLVAAIFLMYLAGTALGIELNPLRKGGREGRGWPIILGMLALPVVWGLTAFCDRRGVFVWNGLADWRYAGVAAYAIGELVRLLALRDLGRQYSAFITVQPEHRLIQHGIYSVIRHPFYLGQLLFTASVPLVFRSPIAIFIFVSTVLFTLNRIRREERFLMQHFDSYGTYRQHSWRLLPYLY
jgi:protein-S-isoprenylcysteine O-methyltransferase Ste14